MATPAETYLVHPSHYAGILGVMGQGWAVGRALGLDHPGMGRMTYTSLTCWHLAHARGAMFHAADAYRQEHGWT